MNERNNHSHWFENVARLATLSQPISIRSCFDHQKQIKCTTCGVDPEQDFWFIQWRKMAGSNIILIYKTDKTLNYIWLEWERISGEESNLSASRAHGLAPLKFIHEMVQVVPNKPFVLQLTNVRRNEWQPNCFLTVKWAWRSNSFT